MAVLSWFLNLIWMESDGVCALLCLVDFVQYKIWAASIMHVYTTFYLPFYCWGIFELSPVFSILSIVTKNAFVPFFAFLLSIYLGHVCVQLYQASLYFKRKSALLFGVCFNQLYWGIINSNRTHPFWVCRPMTFDKHMLPCKHPHNQDTEHFDPPRKFFHIFLQLMFFTRASPGNCWFDFSHYVLVPPVPELPTSGIICRKYLFVWFLLLSTWSVKLHLSVHVHCCLYQLLLVCLPIPLLMDI